MREDIKHNAYMKKESLRREKEETEKPSPKKKKKEKEKKAEVELGRAGRSKTTALLSFRLIIYVKILRKPYHKKKGISVTT